MGTGALPVRTENCEEAIFEMGGPGVEPDQSVSELGQHIFCCSVGEMGNRPAHEVEEDEDREDVEEGTFDATLPGEDEETDNQEGEDHDSTPLVLVMGQGKR